MAVVSGEIYGPPSDGLPHLAVIFHEGQVVASRAFKTRTGAAKFLATFLPTFQAKLDADPFISKSTKKKTKETHGNES
jgi:hypothetical protein